HSSWTRSQSLKHQDALSSELTKWFESSFFLSIITYSLIEMHPMKTVRELNIRKFKSTFFS
uniref:hypothetical protein n=1 Tax=Okeania sp. SIO2F4 TaxID=2607790 RepID=UPI0025FB964F